MRSLEYWFHRILWSVAYKDRSTGITVAVLSAKDEKERALPKILAALQIIHDVAPRRYQRLLRDVNGIVLVGHSRYALGEWYSPLRRIVLASDWVHAEATSSEAIATTIIHEATHARLMRFGNSQPVRGRIERICYYQQALFAAKLREGASLVAQARKGMDRDPSTYASEPARQDLLAALKQLGAPRFLVRLVDRLSVRRAA